MSWDKINFDLCYLKKNPETLPMQSFGIFFTYLIIAFLNSF